MPKATVTKIRPAPAAIDKTIPVSESALRRIQRHIAQAEAVTELVALAASAMDRNVFPVDHDTLALAAGVAAEQLSQAIVILGEVQS